jgi:hypothetical protein
MICRFCRLINLIIDTESIPLPVMNKARVHPRPLNFRLFWQSFLLLHLHMKSGGVERFDQLLGIELTSYSECVTLRLGSVSSHSCHLSHDLVERLGA